MNFSYFPLRKESASTIFQRNTRGEEPKIFRTISKRIFQLLSTPWILPSKYQKIYKDVLLDGGLCHTEGSIERFAQRFSNFTEEMQEESGMHDSSFAFD